MYRRFLLLVVFVVSTLTGVIAQTAAGVSQPTPPASVKTTMDGDAEKDGGAASRRASTGENWHTISIADSGLNLSAIGAVLLGHYETAEYTRELLQVEWRPGDPIDLYVVLPHGVTKPRTILYLYNYTSDTDRFRDDGWCRRATRNGVAAVGFVSALSGQRFHSPRPLKQWFVSELQEALATSTHDVQMVLNYLATRSDIDLSEVGIFGQDSGGAIAILSAAADRRIKAVDVIDPWGAWPDWLRDSRQIPAEERAKYLTPSFLERVAGLDPVNFLPELRGDALRVQQVMDDPITPAVARDRIAAAVPRTDALVRYPSQVAQIKEWRNNGLSGWLSGRLKVGCKDNAKCDLNLGGSDSRFFGATSRPSQSH